MRTKDYLPNNNMPIIQDDSMFRINSDTFALGEFLEVYKNDVVMDLGTNNGALMLYASLFNPKHIIGVEINPQAIEIAKENMELNNVKSYELINEDIKKLSIDPVDVIICNPPYFKTPNQDFGENYFKGVAKHEVLITLDTLVKSINRNLKDNGTLFFLFLTSRLEEVFSEFKKNNLKIKEMKFVFDSNKENSNVVLIKAVKNGHIGLNVFKDLIITR